MLGSVIGDLRAAVPDASVPGWRRLSPNARFAYKLVLPALAMMTLVHFIPIVWGFWVSFVRLDASTIATWWEAPFVGLSNYRAIFDPNSLVGASFWGSVKSTFMFTAGSLIGIYGLGLVSALLMNRQFRGRLAARTLLLVPWIAPFVVTLLTWRMMLSNDTGIVNHYLLMLPFVDEPPFWLIGGNTIYSIIVANVWRNFPFAAIMLYAGLQSIPEQLYEAAEIDGAGRWGKFRYVTLPQLKPVSVVLLLLLTLWSLINFTVPYVLLGGNPSDAANVLMLFVYEYAFSNWAFGLGAAMSAVLFLVSMVLAYAYYRRLIDDEFEGGAI